MDTKESKIRYKGKYIGTFPSIVPIKPIEPAKPVKPVEHIKEKKAEAKTDSVVEGTGELKSLADVKAVFPNARLIEKRKDLSSYMQVARGIDVEKNERVIIGKAFDRARKNRNRK